MKNFVRLRLSGLVLVVFSLFALKGTAVPFITTQLDGGAFSDTTTWYTITIDNGALAISNHGSADRIYLNSTIKDVGDDNLWCFTGNDADGYTIYNKAAGPGLVLSSPTTLSGETGVHGTRNGGDGYVVLKAAGAAGYEHLWQFSSSSDLGGEADVYMYQKGKTANKVNNRSGVLAFWTVGQDHGSTLTIKFAKKKIPVNLQTGSFTSSNSVKTYHSVWTYGQDTPGLTFSHARNNIDLPITGDDSFWRLSGNNSNTFTLRTTSDYIVSGAGLDFYNNNSATEMTVTINGTSRTAYGTATENIAVSDMSEQSAEITLSPSGNNAIIASNIWAVVERSFAEVEPSVELFQTYSGGIPYRIPAIAVAQNGDVIAVSDYRYCRADIGNGRIDLYARISHDNGATWDATKILAQGDGVMNSQGRNYSLTAGYGDACIVADRESPRVLMMSVCGYQTFPNGTRDVPNQVARWYSNDNGATWSEPEYITETFYAPFDNDCTRGPIRSMFIGSGKIHQSRYVKVGQYYRLYCSSLTKDVNSTNCNYVWYSDDFGETWNVLGDKNDPAIPSGADEPKAEELPDGSVIVSSRCNGGRYYNIFSFTDLEKAEGSWGSYAFSGSGNNGVTAVSNSCNGEIIVLPATRNRDGAQVYLALQSVPFGSGRSNVGIYYKELSSFADDFADPSTFAANWDGRHQASSLGSAYSTFALQHDGNLGFLYEEETYGAGYTIVYKNYSLETITNNAYSYRPDADAAAIATMLKAEIVVKASGLEPGNSVGQLDEEAIAAIEAQAAGATGSVEEVAAIHKALAETAGVPLEEGRWYRLHNVLYEERYLTPSTTASSYSGATLAKTNFTQLFTFERDGENWRIKAANLENYIGTTQSTNTFIPQSEVGESGLFKVIPHSNGHTQIACLNPVNGTYNALHINTSANLVSWTLSADASKWYIEPADEVQFTTPSGGFASKMFSFAVTLPEGSKAYAVTGVEETETDTAYAMLTEIAQPVPARTPFVMQSPRGTTIVKVEADVETGVEGNLLGGNLKAASVAADNVYVFRSTAPVGYNKRSSASGTIAANTAYLLYTGTAKFVRIDLDHVTGIASLITVGNEGGAWYDLQGRRVENPRSGVYVNGNGRKVIFK